MLVKMWNKGKQSSIVGGSANLHIHYRNQCGAPQTTRNRCTSRTSYNILGRIPKGHFILPQTLCSAMFTMALFITANSFKLTWWPLTEWIKKIWCCLTIIVYYCYNETSWSKASWGGMGSLGFCVHIHSLLVKGVRTGKKLGENRRQELI